ncbi:MAG TPA: protein kinase [Actinomycetales bacterium]|nr:protein kinase [Actinomycetales bacterium]
MTSLHPQAGLRIGDRYELTQRIAAGGMGEVWAAHDAVLDREVAVKLLRREYADDPGFVERFRAEARHAASLSHSGIAAVYDYGEVDGSAFLVMELVPGTPLSTLIAERGSLPATEAVPLLQQAALALQAAHAAGLVHRDVKPGNLLVTPEGEVKVTDFGIARAGGQAPLTRTGEVMGTAQYLSPEQAMGRTATPASDVYSLGVVSYEALSGRRPFDADNPVAVAMSQVNDAPPPLPDSVPPAVASVVLQALAKDPDERPHSASDFSDALGRAMRGQSPARGIPPVAAPPTQPITGPLAAAAAPPRPATDVLADDTGPRRSVGLWILVALLVAAVVALVVLLLTHGDGKALDDTPGGGPVPSATTSSPSTGATTSAAPTTISLVEDDYLGRPANEVAAELRAKGLRVTTTPQTTAEYRPGTVSDVAPTGNLEPGDRVTLSVAQAPTTSSTSTTTSSPPSPPSTSSSTSTTTTSHTSGTATSTAGSTGEAGGDTAAAP